ncbi:MAG: M3 family metallopeptidase, partial [Oscillospiraceae bacterium]
ITEFDTLEAEAGEQILKKFKILIQNKKIKQANKLTERDVLYCFYKAKNDYYMQNKIKYDEIFMSLIDIRKEISSRTNCKDYAEFCYILSNRSSYTKDDIKGFRDNIKKHITPIYRQLCEKKMQCLGLEKLPFEFSSNLVDVDEPMLKHNDGKLTAKILAHNISPLTNDCLNTLTKYKFMDLDKRENKATGAFTTSFPKYNLPFIFATTENSVDSVNTFIHEFGHAYNFFSNKDNEFNSDRSLDISEIHSHSMEILSLNFYDEILKSDPNEAIAYYMQDLMTLLLTTALNDEFQEEIYTNEINSIDDANKIYKKLQGEYFGDFDFSDLDYYNEGGVYSAISHIYTRPFYMIDYALAVCVAMQIWDIQTKDYEKAFEKYQDITMSDKNMNFSQLLEKNGLNNPIFDEECLQKIGKTFDGLLNEYI